MKVFLGGSRHLSFIPEEVAIKLDDLINDEGTFLVGDAPGSDSAFQSYLARKKYNDVLIFTSAGYVRNNFGNWPAEHVDSGLKSKSAASHAFKDRHMAEMCDLGIMIWDGDSAGTLSNIIDLVDQGIDCYLYVAHEQQFFRIDSKSSLQLATAKYPNVYEEAQKRIGTFRNREKKRIKKSVVTDSLFD